MVDEKRIAMLMKKLDITREEALELEGYDADVNKGKKTQYDLTPEQEKVAKKMTHVTEYAKSASVKRERKPNELNKTRSQAFRQGQCQQILCPVPEEAQGQVYEDVTVTNKSRMIAFSVNGKRFELALVEKREPKDNKTTQK